MAVSDEHSLFVFENSMEDATGKTGYPKTADTLPIQ